MQIHPLIESSAALLEFCDLVKDSDFIAVDTEFMRENTFWPELCLIQVADSHHAAAIDPMAPHIDLKPLLDLLVDTDAVLKVFHAVGQDVEIIYNLPGKTPRAIFDTPVDQMALGQAEQVDDSPRVQDWHATQLANGAPLHTRRP